MAQATVHPNHQLISSEDVEGTNVYGVDGKKIGDIDHLMIEKVSGRVAYAVISFGGCFPAPRLSALGSGCSQKHSRREAPPCFSAPTAGG